jgi:hypothetical protein
VTVFLLLLVLALALGATVALGVLLARRVRQLGTDVNDLRYQLARHKLRLLMDDSAEERRTAVAGAPQSWGVRRASSTGRTLYLVDAGERGTHPMPPAGEAS